MHEDNLAAFVQASNCITLHTNFVQMVEIKVIVYSRS
jgi:hypothetical protein